MMDSVLRLGISDSLFMIPLIRDNGRLVSALGLSGVSTVNPGFVGRAGVATTLTSIPGVPMTSIWGFSSKS